MDNEKTVLLSETPNDELTVQEENIINRNPLWKSPKFIVAVVICIIAVIVVITIVITSAVGEDNDIAQKLEIAQKYLTEMKYEEAKALYEEIIEADPKCEEAYIGLADAYIGLGDEKKAMEVLEEGINKVGETSELKKKLEKLEREQKDETEDKEAEIDEKNEKITTDIATEPEGDVTIEDSEGTEEQDTTTEERSDIYNEETQAIQSTAQQQQTIIKKTEEATKQQLTTGITSEGNEERETSSEASEGNVEWETTGLEGADEAEWETLENTGIVDYENTIVCDMWFDNFSKAYEIDEEGIELTFNSKTFDTIDASSGYYWNTPLYIIHYEDDDYYSSYWQGKFRFIGRSDLFGWIPVFDGKEESDGFDWINTHDGEIFTDYGYTYETEGVPENREEWVKWLEANKNGVDCKLRAVRNGDKIVIEFTNNGVTSKATVPVDENKAVYVTLTGEYCTLSDIQKK